MKNNYLLLLLFSGFLIISCSKDDSSPDTSTSDTVKKPKKMLVERVNVNGEVYETYSFTFEYHEKHINKVTISDDNGSSEMQINYNSNNQLLGYTYNGLIFNATYNGDLLTEVRNTDNTYYEIYEYNVQNQVAKETIYDDGFLFEYNLFYDDNNNITVRNNTSYSYNSSNHPFKGVFPHFNYDAGPIWTEFGKNNILQELGTTETVNHEYILDNDNFPTKETITTSNSNSVIITYEYY